MKYIFLLFLAASFIIIGCDEEGNNKKEINEEFEEFKSLENLPVNEIIGEWKWENSGGGYGGDVFLTPETQGYNRTIIFDSNWKYKEFINSEIVLETYYRVDTTESVMSEYRSYKIYFFEGKDEQDFYIEQNGDTTILVLYDAGCSDCISTHEYSKK